MSFSKETRNCVGNKMKVTAPGVPRELFRRPSDVSGFANFVIKSNKKIETGYIGVDERGVRGDISDIKEKYRTSSVRCRKRNITNDKYLKRKTYCLTFQHIEHI